MNDSWKALESLIATPDLPGLGPTPRPGRLPLLELNEKIDRFFADTNLSAALQASVRSAALLWHDYLDESHAISQNIHSADGSFLHGIMHRREQDYSNAKYWFHRVGRHPAFAWIATQAERLRQRRKGAGVKPGARRSLGSFRVRGRVRAGDPTVFEGINRPGLA